MYLMYFSLYFRKNSISHIIIAGVTTDVGVQLLMREFNDRGFEPCLVEDCTGSYFEGLVGGGDWGFWGEEGIGGSRDSLILRANGDFFLGF